MHKFITFCLLFCLATITAHAQSGNFNVQMLYQWDDDQLPVASPGNLNLQYSSCWGMAVNGHEYAVLGGAGHILIFDITDPQNSFLRAKYPRPNNTIWREFKSYKNRLYAVTDGVPEGLTIYDFSNAPDTIVQTYSSTEFFERSHTITLDTVSGNIYINGGSSGGGMIVLNVKDNPDQPTFVAQVAELPGGGLHDSYVRNDTLYCSSGYGGYNILDFKTNPAEPKFIASISTQGYNHNSWLTTDGRYAYYTEEIPKGRPIQIVDLQEMTTIGQIELVGGGFLDNMVPGGTEAIPHNIYIRDNLLFNSQYEDGLLVYDISNPTMPALKARFDTHPQNSVYNGYFGNWGNYPWLPSGNIVAGDMQNGLYILKVDAATNTGEVSEKIPNIVVSPNPAVGFATISCPDFTQSWHYELLNGMGQRVLAATGLTGQYAQMQLKSLPAGLYTVVVQQENGNPVARKLVID
jgi:choice-of-anchor B domain-containing protein